MSEIKDSGTRREFGTGAVRDMVEGKGRNDLLHPGVMLLITDNLTPRDQFLRPALVTSLAGMCKHKLFDWYLSDSKKQITLIDAYLYCCFLLQGKGDIPLEKGISTSSFKVFIEGTMALAKHYEKGAKKYGDHNWSKGIPSVSFYDSAHRHIDKVILGLNDEPHVEACMFNIVGLLYNNLYRSDLEFKIYAGGKRQNDPEKSITSP